MGRTLGLSFFNDVLHRPVLDESGATVGRVADLSAAPMKSR
jgi:hypothetical protein